MASTVKERTAFILSPDNRYNNNIHPYLMDILKPVFHKVYFVGDRPTRNEEEEIYWEGAINRKRVIYEPMIFFRLFRIFLKYRPSHVISFSPKVNIYAGILSWLFNVKHIAVIIGLGKSWKSVEHKSSLLPQVFRLSLGRSVGIVTMNEANRHYFQRLFPKKEILRIPSEGYVPENNGEQPYEQASKNLFFISRIIPEKGIILLLKTFIEVKKRHPEIQLAVAGELALDDKNGDLQLFRKMIEYDGVRYLGLIDSEMKRKLFSQSGVFVLPSDYGEGLPMVLLEAQSYGCLTVTTNIPGCSDGISPDMREFLCEYSETSLSNALERAINTPKDRARMLGEKASVWVRGHHNIPLVMGMYEKLFYKTGFFV